MTIPNMKLFEEKQENLNVLLKNIWERPDSLESHLNFNQLVDVLVSKMREATTAVYISSNVLLPKVILQEIPRLAQRGVRVYLLLNEFNSMYGSFITNKAIIRVDSTVTGNILLIDPKEESATTKCGFLFAYNSLIQDEKGIHFYVPFDGSQLREAYHYFIYKFWNSKLEYRDVNVRTQNLLPPFDIYPLIDPESFFYNSKDFLYLKKQTEELILEATKSIHIGVSNNYQINELLQNVYLKSEQGVAVTIYTDLYTEHNFLQNYQEKDNISVKAIENLNNFFILVDNHKGLLLSGSLDGQNEIGVLIGSKTVQDLLNRLTLLQPKMWRFHKEVSLGEIKSKTIFIDSFNNNLKEEMIKDTHVVDYGEIKAASLREFFEGTYKPKKKEQDKISRYTINRWKLVPNYLNSNAKKDPLYDQWEKETSRLIKYVGQVLEYAQTVNHEKKAILGSFLGKFFQNNDRDDVEEIIRSLETAYEQMKSSKFDWSHADTLLQIIEEYSVKLSKKQLELKEKKDYYNKKEKWEQDRNEIVGEKDSKIDELQKLKADYNVLMEQMRVDSPEIQKEKSLCQTKLQELEKKLELLEDENKELMEIKYVNDTVLAVCENLDERIKDFQKMKKKDKKNYFPNKVKPYLINKFESIGKKEILEAILASNSIQDTKQKMTYIMQEIAVHSELRFPISEEKEAIIKEFDVLNDEKDKLMLQLQQIEKRGKDNEKDKQVKIKKTEKEMRKLENELNDIDKKLEKLGKEFKYIAKTQENKQFPFTTNFNLNLPKEQLPNVGELYRVGKVRQLAILNQQQLDEGEKEASRLQAELVLLG